MLGRLEFPWLWFILFQGKAPAQTLELELCSFMDDIALSWIAASYRVENRIFLPSCQEQARINASESEVWLNSQRCGLLTISGLLTTLKIRWKLWTVLKSTHISHEILPTVLECLWNCLSVSTGLYLGYRTISRPSGSSYLILKVPQLCCDFPAGSSGCVDPHAGLQRLPLNLQVIHGSMKEEEDPRGNL